MLKSSISISLLSLTILGSACTIKGKGSERFRYETSSTSSGDAAPESADDAAGDVGESETCLKLAEKRKKNAKLMLEGETEGMEEETAEETASCPADTGAEETSDSEESTEEAPAE